VSGEQLKLYLDHNKVVKRQLALEMGISRQSLNQYFAASNISTEVFEAVARGLNTLPEILYAEMREEGLL
jgi:transcriptional regulator with XRE-family HTH domain